MLRDGELPELAGLLGGVQGRELPHACLSESVLSVLPTTTIAAWSTAFTGAPPGEHGVTGNEFFVRSTRELAAPAPVSIGDISPALAVYTDSYLDHFIAVPTVYERLREREPEIRIWVSMSQVHRGADLLLMARRSVIADAATAFLLPSNDSDDSAYADMDEEVVETVIEELDSRGVPDVLTLYLGGVDLYAHRHEDGPDPARRRYLASVIDPALGRLRAALATRGASDPYVIVLSDHGHTEVLHDDRHSLGTDGADEPPEVLRRAGYRVRPFEWKVDADADFQAVFAYNGAMAFLYLADRSGCAREGEVCDWSRPPRFEQDLVPAAEALHRANHYGEAVPELAGTLELILLRDTRGARPALRVYLGHGEIAPLEEWLRENPRERYVAVVERLRELVDGPRGDRAGDVLLLARNGNVDVPEERFYFSETYRSWHGSPSRQDSEVPFILSHRDREASELCGMIERAREESPRIGALTPLLLEVRAASRR